MVTRLIKLVEIDMQLDQAAKTSCFLNFCLILDRMLMSGGRLFKPWNSLVVNSRDCLPRPLSSLRSRTLTPLPYFELSSIAINSRIN